MKPVCRNPLNKVAWYGEPDGETSNVGKKKANELGIYDMSGNAWELCWDWYGDYSNAPQTDPIGPSSGSFKVARGGSCYFVASNCRTGHRNYYLPSFISCGLGLRLVRRL
ncbi:MAG: SUMF1/EgtB/PvdO family nonheme iron enzyme [Rikenellaceae bacterium]